MGWRGRKKASTTRGQWTFRMAFLRLILGTRKCHGPAGLGSPEPPIHPFEESEGEPLRKGRGWAETDGSTQSCVYGESSQRGQVISRLSGDQWCHSILWLTDWSLTWLSIYCAWAEFSTEGASEHLVPRLATLPSGCWLIPCKFFFLTQQVTRREALFICLLSLIFKVFKDWAKIGLIDKEHREIIINYWNIFSALHSGTKL